MSSCTLTLYRIENFDSSKRFKIEDIESFLEFNQKASETIAVQYQKLNLSMNIKLNMPQSSIVGDFAYNYATLHYDSENKDFYFFIENYEWIALSTISLSLLMDVLNSISFTFDKKTKILREHRNTLSSFYQVGGTNNIIAKRLIDDHAEGLQVPLFRKEELEAMTLQPVSSSNLSTNVNKNWFLIYRSSTTPDSNIPNKIYECFLCAESPIKLYDSEGLTSSVTFSPSSFSKANYFYYADTGQGPVKVSYALSNGVKVEETITQDDEAFITIAVKDATHFNVWYSSRGVEVDSKSGTCETFTIISGSFGHYASSPRRKVFDDVIALPLKWYWNASQQNNFTIRGIDDVDKTDTRLIKIIEIPYQPIELLLHGLPSARTYEIGPSDKPYFEFSQEMQMLAFSYPWKTISKSYYAGNELVAPLSLTATIKSKADYDDEGRDDEFYESKLFHSDFYEQSIIYDSFRWTLDLEKVDVEDIPASIEIDFHFTNTINSRFIFVFNIPFNKELSEDFANVLNVSRNNELPLLNSEYLDYVRNGYNFDVKAKQRKEFNIVARAGLTLASALTGGNGNPISFFGTALSTIQGVQDLAQSEENMERKIQQSTTRSIAVSGADAYDLMNIYAQNRLLRGVYQVSDSMRIQISDLFYYFGYAINENGIPDTSSRAQFNFVQANAVFKNEGLMRSDYRERLKDLFNLGVTYIHKYENFQGDYTYDLEQISANRQKDYDDFLKRVS